MRVLRTMVRWYFAPNKPDSRWWRVVAWWELRRIPYNMLVGAWGFGSLVIYYLALKGSGELKPGDDAVEPMALMVAPFVINAGYTLGWFVELALRALLPLQVNKSTLGPALMKAGVAFSLLAATLPAAIWVTIWLARELHGGR